LTDCEKAAYRRIRPLPLLPRTSHRSTVPRPIEPLNAYLGRKFGHGHWLLNATHRAWFADASAGNLVILWGK
jgi:hypothetical protein